MFTSPPKVAVPKLLKLYTTSLPLVSLVAISIYADCALLSTDKSVCNLTSPPNVAAFDVENVSDDKLPEKVAPVCFNSSAC